MVSELIQRRADGDGFQTIAIGLKISRNTVKNRLRRLGAYEVEDAQKLLLGGFTAKSVNIQYVPEWSHLLAWDQVISDIMGGSTIREYWEIHFEPSSAVDLRNITYETFRREFRRRHPSLDVYYHKTHDPGVRCEIDYKGDTPGLGYIDRATGQFMDCRLFGSVLCHSRLFFPLATPNEKQISWMEGVEKGFQYFGGCSELTVADNTRCAVKQADWFDPDLNPEFYNFCLHHKTTLLAARPRRPTDKNLIEVHLGVFWRWARRKLKNHPVFSLGELNQFLRELADEFNLRYQRKYGSSRRERFEKNERAMLRPLPTKAYESGEWTTAILHDDCHIQFKYNFYSAPYQHRGKELDVRATFSQVEIFYQQERIAIHLRRPESQRGIYATDKTHLPERFQAMEELTIIRQISEAKKVGAHAGQIIEILLTESSHPLLFLRRTMGILRLKSRYSASKLERACEVLLNHGVTKPKVKDVERMINSPNLEKRPVALPIERKPNPHLRGQMSFTTEGENKYGPSTESDGSVFNGTLS